MAPPTEPTLPPATDNGVRGETTVTSLTVHGTLPAGLSGRLLGIGPDCGTQDGVVHSVHLHAGRAISYRSRCVITDAVALRLGVDLAPGPRGTGPDIVASNIIGFGGSILALGDGSLAYELTADLDTLRRVDLAGQSRGLSAFPKHDPFTGELHLLAAADAENQAHVVVSSGALTRTSRPIAGAPNRIKDLAISRDHVAFVADGFVGVTRRDGEARITWITTGVDAPVLVHAHDVGETVVALAITPALERWTMHPTSESLDREALDPAPRHFARTSDHGVDMVPRFLWATGEGIADKHDLTTTNFVSHIFRPDRTPSDLVFVSDDARCSAADGGWLVGFVHHMSGAETDLVVLDAADIASPAIATVRIPRRVPRGLHSTWIASTHR